uniref:Uncharacterized protein n=1 Tax=Oryza sativa subsp. japonica TaxID=39947 RepID=Q84YQ3_ORYSJ|nr:hypothetical protein [Oryza sativa Japonica Group]
MRLHMQRRRGGCEERWWLMEKERWWRCVERQLVVTGGLRSLLSTKFSTEFVAFFSLSIADVWAAVIVKK